MNLRKKLSLALLALALSFGTQSIAMSQASAKPFETLTKSRKGGKRTHKKAGKSSSKDKKSDSKKRTTTNRRVVRRTTRPSTTNTTRTRHYRRPSNSTSSTTRHGTSSTRTVRNVRPRTTSTRTVRNVRPRTTTRTRTTTTTRVRRGSTSRRTYYRQGAAGSHSHSHTTVNSRSGSTHRRGARVRDTSGSTAVEAYLTGGLGISGFSANEITDLPLPGAGYNLALGAKGKYVGGELSLNGGGYTFEPGSGSADISMVGLSGDIKLQPSFGFFEPYVAAGIGGYALKDAVIDEGAVGLGLRLGLGADFRFRQFAVRVKYQHGSYGLNDVKGQYDGDLTAHTETVGANLVVYF